MARLSGKARRMIRAAIVTAHRSRVRMDVPLTAATVKTSSLLSVDDDPDYDLTSNDTNIAEAEALSRLKRIDLNISYFSGTANAAGALVEWVLYRDPDNIGIITNLSDLFIADVTANSLAVRKNVVAYGGFYSSANNDTQRFRIGIKRAAMRRISRLSDNDRLKFSIITAATGAKFFMYGAITWAK